VKIIFEDKLRDESIIRDESITIFTKNDLWMLPKSNCDQTVRQQRVIYLHFSINPNFPRKIFKYNEIGHIYA